MSGEHTQSSAGGALPSVRIVEIWKRLGGGDLRNGRGRAFWRRGDGFKVALDLERGRWFDHAAGAGGGVLALVRTALASDRRAALAWLTAEGFVEARNQSPEQRRAYKRRCDAASVIARDIEHWRAALAEELNAHKVAALETGDFEALAPVAWLCSVLECGTPEAVAGEFFRYRRVNSEEAAVLVEAGRARSEESGRLAAAVVAVLAHAAGSEVPSGPDAIEEALMNSDFDDALAAMLAGGKGSVTEDKIDDDTLPDFPETAWRGAIADYHEAMTGTTEASDVAHFSAFWAAAAVTLGRRVSMYAGERIFANVYLSVFGPTGDKKTTAQRRILNCGLLALSIRIIRNLGSTEGLADALKRDDGADMVALFFWEELTALLARGRWSGSTILEFITETFDCPPEWGMKYRKDPISPWRRRL